MTDAREPLPEFTELETIETLTLPNLTVNVDFNDLIETRSVEEAFELIGKLKDLLQ